MSRWKVQKNRRPEYFGTPVWFIHDPAETKVSIPATEYDGFYRSPVPSPWFTTPQSRLLFPSGKAEGLMQDADGQFGVL